MVVTCPCCGAALTEPPSVEALAEFNFGPTEGVIVRALVSSYPRAITAEKLITEMYSGVRGGGPTFAMSNLPAQLSKIRKKLSPYGWTINSDNRGRGKAYYALRKV